MLMSNVGDLPVARITVFRMLPFRGGPHPLPHSLTTFTNVRLPPTALLGSVEKPKNIHANLMEIISRINVGTLALGCLALPFLQCYATIGTLYSLRRYIGPAADPERRTPILSFRTQQAPILAAAANAYVLQALQRWAISQFCASRDLRVRAGIAAVFKGVMVQHSQQGALGVSERCGAQGLFEHNQMTCLHVSRLHVSAPAAWTHLARRRPSSRTRCVGSPSPRATSWASRSVRLSASFAPHPFSHAHRPRAPAQGSSTNCSWAGTRSPHLRTPTRSSRDTRRASSPSSARSSRARTTGARTSPAAFSRSASPRWRR